MKDLVEIAMLLIGVATIAALVNNAGGAVQVIRSAGAQFGQALAIVEGSGSPFMMGTNGLNNIGL